MNSQENSRITERCCDSDCDFGRKNEQCWGQIRAVDEEWIEKDFYWIHACAGHAGIIFGREYIPEGFQ